MRSAKPVRRWRMGRPRRQSIDRILAGAPVSSPITEPASDAANMTPSSLKACVSPEHTTDKKCHSRWNDIAWGSWDLTRAPAACCHVSENGGTQKEAPASLTTAQRQVGSLSAQHRCGKTAGDSRNPPMEWGVLGLGLGLKLGLGIGLGVTCGVNRVAPARRRLQAERPRSGGHVRGEGAPFGGCRAVRAPADRGRRPRLLRVSSWSPQRTNMICPAQKLHLQKHAVACCD